MSQIVYRPDAYDIARPYLAPSDRIGFLIDDMKQPAYTWRKWLRHLYVLTWPLSLITRIVMFLVMGITWLVVGFAGYVAARLAYIWAGERSPWE